MNDIQLCKVWTVLGLFISVFTLDSWMRTQGLDPLFGSSLPHNQRPASAIFRFVVIVVLAPLHLYTAITYSKRQVGSFHNKVPIAFFVSLDTKATEAKIFQSLMYFALHIFPVLGVIHFYRLILASVYVLQADCRMGIEDRAFSVWTLPATYVWDNGYRLGDCEGVTFFPLIQPVFFTLLALALLLMNLHFLRITSR